MAFRAASNFGEIGGLGGPTLPVVVDDRTYDPKHHVDNPQKQGSGAKDDGQGGTGDGAGTDAPAKSKGKGGTKGKGKKE